MLANLCKIESTMEGAELLDRNQQISIWFPFIDRNATTKHIDVSLIWSSTASLRVMFVINAKKHNILRICVPYFVCEADSSLCFFGFGRLFKAVGAISK